MTSKLQEAILFDDLFDVIKVNPEGKKFERVDRIVCKGETYEMDLYIDIANEVFSLKTNEKFTFTLSSTLNLDGSPDSDEYTADTKPTLLDEYDYGMCGKVFKYEYLADKKVAIVASFGGLLMLIQGEQKHVMKIQLDQKIYALIRKVGGTR